MKNLQLSDDNARKLYPTADPVIKLVLEDSWGKDFFSQKITDRIQNFDDILSITGKTMDDMARPGDEDDEVAYKQAKLIAFAYNGNKFLDAGDTDKPKYSIYHKIVKDTSKPSGFGLSYYDYDGWVTVSVVGVRLCFEDYNHAIDAWKKFPEIYERLKIR